LDWAAYEDWIGAAQHGRAVRFSAATGIETIDHVPESKMLNGSYAMAFAANGDLVIALDYRFARYVVWPAGSKTLSPIRTLAPGDTLAAASPTFIVRGIGLGAPPATIAAVLPAKTSATARTAARTDIPKFAAAPMRTRPPSRARRPCCR
jgi:hypothetical protein